jgi:hypothetical protein
MVVRAVDTSDGARGSDLSSEPQWRRRKNRKGALAITRGLLFFCETSNGPYT